MEYPHQPALRDSVNNLSAQGIDTWRAVRGGLYSVDAFAVWPTSRPETPRTQAPAYYDSPHPISTPFAAMQLANEKSDNVGPAITPLADGAPSVPVDVAELGAFAPVHNSSTVTQSTSDLAQRAVESLKQAEPSTPVEAIASSDGPADEQASSTLLNLPPEILDIVLAMDYDETDHLALSGVCQLLRKMYSKTVLCAIGSPYHLKYITNAPAKVILGSIATRYIDDVDVDANQVIAEPVRSNNRWAFWAQDNARVATPESLRAHLSAIQGSHLSRPISKSAGKTMYKETSPPRLSFCQHLLIYLDDTGNREGDHDGQALPHRGDGWGMESTHLLHARGFTPTCISSAWRTSGASGSSGQTGKDISKGESYPPAQYRPHAGQ